MANCRVCTPDSENSMHVCSTCRNSLDTCIICDGNSFIDDGYDVWPCWKCADVIEAIEDIYS